MHRYLLAAGLLAASGFAPAQATEGFGKWEATRGVASRGTPFCAMHTAVRGRNVGQNVWIKHFQGREVLNITMYKDSWLIPRGADVPVVFDFANNEPLPLVGYGDGHIVDVEVPTQLVAAFLLALSERPSHAGGFPQRPGTNMERADCSNGSQSRRGGVRAMHPCWAHTTIWGF